MIGDEFEISVFLMDAAEKLASKRGIPLPIAKLCGELGVKIERTATGRARALLVDAKKNPRILLRVQNRLDERYTPWERFLIAHELGHLVLHHRDFPRPQEPGDYWETERLCDAFARRLLAPESRFGHLARGAENTPAQRLNLARYIERTAEITWAAAAMRVSDWHPTAVFFHLKTEDDGNLKVAFSSTRKEMGRKIVLNTLLAKALLEIAPPDELKILEPDLLQSLPSVSQARSCAAMRTQNHFRLVAVLEQNTNPILANDSSAA
jgi:Zn-dependent peptidase ImmA (M78 family)